MIDFVSTNILKSASRVFSRPSGLGADGRGRKRSPGRGVASAGTGKAQTLRNFTRGYHRLHYGSRRRKITQLAVFLNPRPPPELPPGLPAPIRRSCRRRGGHCVARPSYHSAGARDREDRITWRCATKRLVSVLLRAASPTIFLGAGEVNRRAGVEGWKPAGRSRASLDRGQRSLGSGWTYAS